MSAAIDAVEIFRKRFGPSGTVSKTGKALPATKTDKELLATFKEISKLYDGDLNALKIVEVIMITDEIIIIIIPCSNEFLRPTLWSWPTTLRDLHRQKRHSFKVSSAPGKKQSTAKKTSSGWSYEILD
jgi:hypothetical protein